MPSTSGGSNIKSSGGAHSLAVGTDKQRDHYSTVWSLLTKREVSKLESGQAVGRRGASLRSCPPEESCRGGNWERRAPFASAYNLKVQPGEDHCKCGKLGLELSRL